MARIDLDELHIGRQLVALDRDRIGFFRTDLAERPALVRRHRHRRRRRYGCGLGGHENHALAQRGDLPWRLPSLRQLMGAGTYPREGSGDIEPGGAHHFGDGGGVGSVRPGRIGDHLPGSSGKTDQEVLRRLDRDQSGWKSCGGERERQAAGRVDGENLGAGRHPIERPDQVGETHRVERNVAFAIELCIDGREIILAVEGKSVPGQVDKQHGVGSDGLGLGEKVPKRLDEIDLVEIGALDDFEPDRAQRLGHQPRIIERGRQRRLPVLGIADDEGDARRLLCADGHSLNPHEKSEGDQRNQPPDHQVTPCLQCGRPDIDISTAVEAATSRIDCVGLGHKIQRF